MQQNEVITVFETVLLFMRGVCRPKRGYRICVLKVMRQFFGAVSRHKFFGGAFETDLCLETAQR